jgi:hypothetical protein
MREGMSPTEGEEDRKEEEEEEEDSHALGEMTRGITNKGFLS